MPIVKAHHTQNRIEKQMKVLETQGKKSAEKVKEAKKILSDRIARETKFIPRRLLDLVSRDEHFKRAYMTFSDLQAANQAQAQAQAQSQSIERVPKIAAKASNSDANILEMAKVHRSGGNYHVIKLSSVFCSFELINSHKQVLGCGSWITCCPTLSIGIAPLGRRSRWSGGYLP